MSTSCEPDLVHVHVHTCMYSGGNAGSTVLMSIFFMINVAVLLCHKLLIQIPCMNPFRWCCSSHDAKRACMDLKCRHIIIWYWLMTKLNITRLIIRTVGSNNVLYVLLVLELWSRYHSCLKLNYNLPSKSSTTQIKVCLKYGFRISSGAITVKWWLADFEGILSEQITVI